MKKRILFLMIVLCLIMGLAPAVAAEEIASGTCGDNLHWSVENGTLSITGSGDMYDYGSGLENDDGEIVAPAPWDQYSSEIHTIHMDDGITAIGDYAFMFMESLSEIELPSSLTSIGSHSLYWLPITEIRIPEGVFNIGEYAFGHCHDLTEVYFPSTLRSVGKAAFYENYDIERVYIPDLESWFQIQFTSFFSTPFTGGTLLYVDGVPVTDIVVPENVTVIGEGQFDRYSSMTSLQLHDNITSIGDYAFDCNRGAIQMTQLIIPESVEYIGHGAFRYWSHLSDIYIMNPTCELGEDICFESNCYFDEELDEMVWGVTTIHGYAGSTAEAHAQEYNHPFVELASLTDIPEGLTYQNYNTCIEISSYTGTESILEIPKTIEGLPVTRIGYSFQDCPTLTQVILPDTIKYIYPNAFTNFPKLELIAFSGSCPNYTTQNGVLYNADMTNLIRYPSAKKGSFTVPDSVTYIEHNAFQYSTGLISLTLPRNYTARIDHSMFSYCTNLEEITIPAGITEIRDLAFANCSSLTSINVDENNSTYRSIDGVLFNKDGTVLEIFPSGISGHYVIPENVTVAYRAFYTKNHLTKLTFSNNVDFEDAGVGAGAWGYILHGCSDLTEIAVSADNSNYSVSDGILYTKDGTGVLCCPQGKSGIVDIPDGVSRICYGSFPRCNNLTGLVIPKSLTNIQSAFTSNDPLDIYYAGTEDEWSTVAISDGPFGDVSDNYEHGDNYAVLHANMHYNVTNFEDNPTSTWYAEPVLWAVSSGITTGITPTTFAPYDSCLRSQVVTFLWRANGSPVVEAENPFVDVKPSDYYYNAVLWAVKLGITSGLDETHFGPNETCNRSQVVTFLWRADGSPVVEADNPFEDVEPSDYYYDAVLWAVKNGITNGLDTSHFGPNDPCNRSQVVTFLYRFYN